MPYLPICHRADNGRVDALLLPSIPRALLARRGQWQMPNVPHSNALSIVANQTAARGFTSSILTMDPPPPHIGAASSSWPQPAAAQLNTEKYIALSAVDWPLYITAPRGADHIPRETSRASVRNSYERTLKSVLSAKVPCTGRTCTRRYLKTFSFRPASKLMTVETNPKLTNRQ